MDSPETSHEEEVALEQEIHKLIEWVVHDQYHSSICFKRPNGTTYIVGEGVFRINRGNDQWKQDVRLAASAPKLAKQLFAAIQTIETLSNQLKEQGIEPSEKVKAEIAENKKILEYILKG